MDSTLKKGRDAKCALLTILRENKTCTIFQELFRIQTDLHYYVFTPNLS